MEKISERVTGLTDYLVAALRKIRHDSGLDLVRIFGPKDRANSGGTIVMNFFDANGNLFHFEDIVRMANSKLISLRSGCFCNPGIDEVNHCLTTAELSDYFSGRVYGDYYDMIAFLKKMRGATRVSVGIATKAKDLEVFISFVKALKNKTIPVPMQGVI
jgi:selenocysteine lyase/cysteine desulfurase